MRRAACTGSSANFFPTQMGESGVKQAVAICGQCPVQIRCVQFALSNNIRHGIWGGYTARGRRELANALEYVADFTRQEHATAHWYAHYVRTNDEDPVRRTAQTLGISKATVYHHLRIDRLAQEKTDAIINHTEQDNDLP